MLLTNRPSSSPPSGAALRWRGTLAPEVLARQPRRGRQRQWVYAAAADETLVVGAAVVDLGLLGLGTAFAFCFGPAGSWTWEPGLVRHVEVDGVEGTATARRGDARVWITPRRLEVDVTTDRGLRAAVDLARATPVSLLTPTPRGGWNATTKAAGHDAAGSVALGDDVRDLVGAAWSDATRGRQDRHTTWRWAAGVGRSADGRRVGLQASTGMNALGPGEDLVWWEEEPHPLQVASLAPHERADDGWTLRGDSWSLRLDPWGARSAREGLGPLRSRYHQPVGVWQGTLPDPGGTPTAVVLRGVAEDHEARW